MKRRNTKKALKEARVLTRMSCYGYVLFVFYYGIASILAPWPSLPNISGVVAPYWEIKIAVSFIVLLSSISFYLWFVRYGWKTQQLIIWKWFGYFLMSFPGLLISMICAFQGARSTLLGICLLSGWMAIFLYFFLRIFFMREKLYKLMADRKMVKETGEYYPEVSLPSFREISGSTAKPTKFSGGGWVGFFAALGGVLSSFIFNSMGDRAELMNYIWLSLHYLLACLTAPVPAIMVFEIFFIYNWKSKMGNMPILAKLVKV